MTNMTMERSNSLSWLNLKLNLKNRELYSKKICKLVFSEWTTCCFLLTDNWHCVKICCNLESKTKQKPYTHGVVTDQTRTNFSVEARTDGKLRFSRVFKNNMSVWKARYIIAFAEIFWKVDTLQNSCSISVALVDRENIMSFFTTENTELNKEQWQITLVTSRRFGLKSLSIHEEEC